MRRVFRPRTCRGHSGQGADRGHSRPMSEPIEEIPMRAAKLAPYAVALALGAAAASVPSVVFAQSAAPQAQRQERPNRIEGRIAFLRAELQITQAQTQLWEAV